MALAIAEVASVPGLRPTPDRVRETVFNWLGQDLTGMAVLDLFAGTGAMGFEAASRGASKVTMVEQSSAACAALQQAVKTLQAEGVEIVRGDAVKFAATTSAGFDVIFLDPLQQGSDRARGAAAGRNADPGVGSMWRPSGR